MKEFQKEKYFAENNIQKKKAGKELILKKPKTPCIVGKSNKTVNVKADGLKSNIKKIIINKVLKNKTKYKSLE